MTQPNPSWTPLAERLSSLPLILAGPILRRVEPRSVTVWVALREARDVTLRVYRLGGASGSASGMTERLLGSRRTVRLGDQLHMAAVTARAADETQVLEPGAVYWYNLSFEDERAAGAVTDLRSPGVLVRDPESADEVERLVYAGMPLPSFVLPATTLEHVRIFHGSCRKPHGVGRDALATLDLALSAAASDPLNRPQQLYLTGDQIYADDVAAPLLPVLMDAAETLVGPEKLPGLPPDIHLVAPGHRTWAVHEMAHFTTATAENHVLTRGEYLALYLFAWSGVLWPAALPSQEDVQRAYPEARPEENREREQAAARWRLDEGELADFRETLPHVRRALANTPTYMACDDHDVTDDWYLDGAWCANVIGSPLGRRVVRNALYAYALCQAWGNDPDQFDGPNGRSFLEVVDRWHGDIGGSEGSEGGEGSEGSEGTDGHADALLLEEHLGLPEEFSGTGTLPRGERALRWHFTVETPAYRMVLLDERTRRVYDHPHAAPGLLSEEALAEQIGEPIAADERLMLLVAQTPVLGVDIVEKIQLFSLDHYAYDRESWSLNRRIYQSLLRSLARFGRVVILSGDVHYGFGATLECWAKAEGSAAGGVATIVNFTSSAFKNAAAGVHKALLTVTYPHLFHLLSRGRMPPIDLFAWDEDTPGNANALAAASRAVRRGALAVWWSVPRLATLLRSPSALMLPAHGWPARTFDKCPPERRVRLRYLRDACLPSELEEPSLGGVAALGDLKITHHQQVRETVAALTGEAHIGLEQALEATRVLESSEHPHAVRLGVAQRLLELVHTVFGGNGELQERLDAGIGQLLHAAVTQPDLWTRVWSDGGLHIVGDANIGEIVFDEGGQVAVQRLWWCPPDEQHSPRPATEYRASLQSPAAAAAPALP